MLLQAEQLTKWQLFSLKMTTSTILSEIDVILCAQLVPTFIFFSAREVTFLMGQLPKFNKENGFHSESWTKFDRSSISPVGLRSGYFCDTWIFNYIRHTSYSLNLVTKQKISCEESKKFITFADIPHIKTYWKWKAQKCSQFFVI